MERAIANRAIDVPDRRGKGEKVRCRQSRYARAEGCCCTYLERREPGTGSFKGAIASGRKRRGVKM